MGFPVAYENGGCFWPFIKVIPLIWRVFKAKQRENSVFWVCSCYNFALRGDSASNSVNFEGCFFLLPGCLWAFQGHVYHILHLHLYHRPHHHGPGNLIGNLEAKKKATFKIYWIWSRIASKSKIIAGTNSKNTIFMLFCLENPSN